MPAAITVQKPKRRPTNRQYRRDKNPHPFAEYSYAERRATVVPQRSWIGSYNVDEEELDRRSELGVYESSVLRPPPESNCQGEGRRFESRRHTLQARGIIRV